MDIFPHIPTLSLDVISLVVSSCRYFRGQSSQTRGAGIRGARATQRGNRETSTTKHNRHRRHAQPVCAHAGAVKPRLPRLPPWRCQLHAPAPPLREGQKPDWAHTGEKRPYHQPLTIPDVMPALLFSLLFSPPARAFSTLAERWQALDMTVHSGNHEGDTVTDGVYPRTNENTREI